MQAHLGVLRCSSLFARRTGVANDGENLDGIVNCHNSGTAGFQMVGSRWCPLACLPGGLGRQDLVQGGKLTEGDTGEDRITDVGAWTTGDEQLQARIGELFLGSLVSLAWAL